jgi:dihydroflavonol-4-reductase
LPRPVLVAVATAEAAAQLTVKEPFVTVDGLQMSKNQMFFSSAKAERELGYRPTTHLGRYVRRWTGSAARAIWMA